MAYRACGMGWLVPPASLWNQPRPIIPATGSSSVLPFGPGLPETSNLTLPLVIGAVGLALILFGRK